MKIKMAKIVIMVMEEAFIATLEEAIIAIVGVGTTIHLSNLHIPCLH